MSARASGEHCAGGLFGALPGRHEPPGSALTLPGITGFILSIGMAVDANVLIFERLKEELWAEKSSALRWTWGSSVRSVRFWTVT